MCKLPHSNGHFDITVFETVSKFRFERKRMFRTPYLSNAAQPLQIVQNSKPKNKREKICDSFWYSLLLNISKHTMCFVAESEENFQPSQKVSNFIISSVKEV